MPPFKNEIHSTDIDPFVSASQDHDCKVKTVQLILSKDVKADQIIQFSWKDPFVGTVVITAWCFLIYYLSLKKDFPQFIVGVNVFFIVIFILILFRQIKGRIRRTIPFLLGANGSSLLIPFNYSIKVPTKDLNLILEMDSSEIESIVLNRRTYHIYHRSTGSHHCSTYIQSHVSLDIQLRESLTTHFYQQLEKVIRQEGFTGSPLYSSSTRHIEYVMPDQGLKIEKIRKLLLKRFSATYNGPVQKSSIRLLPSESHSSNFILEQAHRLFCLGDRILAANMLDALLPDRSQEVMNRLRKLPLFENK